MKNITECLALREVPTHPAYVIIFSTLTLSSSMAIVLTTILTIRFYRNTTFHLNVKILVYVLFFFGFVFSFIVDSTFVFYIYNLIFENHPCSLIFYVRECSWSFVPLTTCIIGFNLIQAAFTIERVIATCRLGRYEHRAKCVGPILGLSVLLLSVLCVQWGLETANPNELQYQCGGVPASSAERMILIYFIMLAVDILLMIVFVCCLHHNKKKLNSGRFHLEIRYEIQENLKVIHLELPIVVIHFIVFGFFSTGSILIRQFRGEISYKIYGIALLALYILPHYFLLVAAIMYGILRQESRRMKLFRDAIAHRSESEKEGETYFESLKQQWSKMT